MEDRIPKLNKKNNKVQLDLSNINDFASLKTANDAGTLRGDILANNDGTGTDVIGTPLTKGTLLSDTTCDVLGIPHTAVLNDAILGLAIGAGKYGFKIHLQTAGGNPIGSCLIQGVTRPNGTQAFTDNNGDVLVVSTSTNPVVTVNTWFIDCPSSSWTLTSTGVLTSVTLTMTRNTTTSCSTNISYAYHFSADVNTINYTIAGAGGGGGGGAATLGYNNSGDYSYGYASGGGGGSGYVINQSFTNNINLAVNVVVGAGGVGGAGKAVHQTNGYSGANETGVTGGNGGATTISQGNTILATANGGIGGTGGHAESGYLPTNRGGNGGIGQVSGSNGGTTSTAIGGAGGVLASYGGYGNGGSGGGCTTYDNAASNNGATGAGGACWLNWTFK